MTAIGRERTGVNGRCAGIAAGSLPPVRLLLPLLLLAASGATGGSCWMMIRQPLTEPQPQLDGGDSEEEAQLMEAAYAAAAPAPVATADEAEEVAGTPVAYTGGPSNLTRLLLATHNRLMWYNYQTGEVDVVHEAPVGGLHLWYCSAGGGGRGGGGGL